MSKKKTKTIPKRIDRPWVKEYKKFNKQLREDGCWGSFDDCPEDHPTTFPLPKICFNCPHKQRILKEVKMSETKQLQPHEYSESRKQAIKEIGQNVQEGVKPKIIPEIKQEEVEQEGVEQEIKPKVKSEYKWTKIKCIGCGKIKECDGNRYQKLVAKNMVETYKCKDCRKQKTE